MDTPLLTRSDLLTELKLPAGTLVEWEKLGLLRPISGGDGNAVYGPDALDAARQIKALLDAGYDLPGVQKIVRKVGLPSSRGGRQKNDARRLITVGELAEKTGLNARTIRYWEERGIIAPDGRSTGGFRLYSERTVTICQLVKDLQVFGYSLEEIKEGASLLRDFFAYAEGAIPEDGDEAVERLNFMLEQIEKLETRMDTLKQGIRRWEDLFRKRKKEIHRMRDRVLPPAPKKGAKATSKS